MLLEAKPTLLFDSREQLPYKFERFSDQFKHIQKHKLLAGDYSILGFETKISFERKSLQDLVQTVIYGRDRFKAELSKLHYYDHAAVVIEATMKQVSSPYTFSEANPSSVIESLRSWALIYGVHFVFASDRVIAEEHIANSLLKFYRYHRENTP